MRILYQKIACANGADFGVYFPTANGKDSSEVGKMGMFEGMKKPRAGELQGA
jgi:hypothetical protein